MPKSLSKLVRSQRLTVTNGLKAECGGAGTTYSFEVVGPAFRQFPLSVTKNPASAGSRFEP